MFHTRVFARPLATALLAMVAMPLMTSGLMAADDKTGKKSPGCNNGGETGDGCTPTTSCVPCGDCTTTTCDEEDNNYPDYSLINVRSQIHLHTAFDYQIATSLGGCTPCGGASAPSTPLRHLEIQRIHRQRSIGSGGSLGSGTYLSFDKQIEITRDTGNTAGVAASVRYFDPANPSIKMTLNERSNGDATIDGVLHDAAGQFTELRFLKADGTTTADWTQAATARLTTTMGRTFVFEVMRTSSDPASTARSGRLIQEIDRHGNAETIAYVHPVTASDATLGNDRSKLWQYQSVTGHFGEVATFTWDTTKRGSRYGIKSIALPNGATVGYRYNGSSLIGVDHADGSASSFSSTYDTTVQKTVYAWDDNAAGGTHMRKKTYVTGSTWVDPVTGASSSQAAGQIVRVDNANNEMRFLMWTESTDANRRFIWRAETGLIAYKTDGGGRNVVKVEWATSYDLSQPTTTYTFEKKKDFINDSAREAVTQATDAAGRVTKNAYKAKTRLVEKRTEADNSTTVVLSTSLSARSLEIG
jgi:YD repeat-containing protein